MRVEGPFPRSWRVSVPGISVSSLVNVDQGLDELCFPDHTGQGCHQGGCGLVECEHQQSEDKQISRLVSFLLGYILTLKLDQA